MVFRTEDPKKENSSTSSTEHQLPLEETLDDNDVTSRYNPTFSCSSASDSSMDEYFAPIETMEGYIDGNSGNQKEDDKDKDDFHNYKQQLPEARTELLNNRSTLKHQQPEQPRKEAALTQATRRTQSTHTESYETSVANGFTDDFTHTHSKENGSYYIDYNESLDNHKKRSMEIRMDGHVTELTHTDSGNDVTTALRPISSIDNKNITSSIVNSTTSLSWADSDDVVDYIDDGGSIHIGPEENGFNRNYPTSFASPEDGSDASNTTGTPFVFADRCKDLFNFRRISLVIVKWMPCFWLCCFRHNNQLYGGVYPDRFILARLNVLSFFFAAVQLAATLWLCVVLFVDGPVDGPDKDFRHAFHLWNNNAVVAGIGCLAVVLLFTCFWTIRIVKEVDLVGALRFLWLLLWILPIAALLNIVAFDYHEVTSILIIHYWNSAQMWWFRERFCPLGTAETLCRAPINAGDEWCSDLYNTTVCNEIRDEAQEETLSFLLFFDRTLASWGCAYIFVMFLIIKCLERIISKPVVQKSREVNVVGWLTFPVFCTALFGGVNILYPYSYLDKLNEQRWVAYLYLIAAGLFLIALLMAWFLSAFSIRSNIDKQNKSKAALILIGVLFINAFVLITIFVTSIFWSHHLMLTNIERGTIACTVNHNECTNCDATIGPIQCPEWSYDDVTGIVRRQLQQSAILAAIFILYDLNVIMYGLNLRKHLRMYEIDYV